LHANRMHYNPPPHTVVEVPEELVRLTPIGWWAINACSKVADVISEQGLPKFTAYNVLKFLVELNSIFLQDAATIMIQHPKRICNPLFRLEVFQTSQFQVSFWILQFGGCIFTVLTNSLFSSCLKIKLC
jgi:hypothetical protein